MTRSDGFQALAPAPEGGRESLMLSGEGHSKEPVVVGLLGGHFDPFLPWGEAAGRCAVSLRDALCCQEGVIRKVGGEDLACCPVRETEA